MRPILMAPLWLALACTAADDEPTIITQTSNASDPSAVDSGSEDSSASTQADGSSSVGDASDAGSSADESSDAAPDDTSDSDPSTDGTGGGLPDGVLAEGELYPADIIRLGEDLYWVNQMDGDCVRRVPMAGGAAAVDVACEPSDDTFPLQVIEYNGMLAYSYMSTSVAAQSGFGGVRLVDPAGGAPQTIDEHSRFRSSSSSPFCNDTLTASGSHLFWYAHILSEHDSAIVHFDGNAVSSFAADSPFPYGPIATPTTVYWSATEAYEMLPLTGLGGTPTTIGMTIGSTCGRTADGETLYLASRGTFSAVGALFRASNGLFSNVKPLDELVYDLAVDATHLYLAFGARIDRLPLADLEGGAFETVVEGPTIGGLLVDSGNLYWTDYDAGEVRVQPVQ